MRLKRNHNLRKPELELTVKYKRSPSNESRIIIKLFAEMLRLYVEGKSNLGDREAETKNE